MLKSAVARSCPCTSVMPMRLTYRLSSALITSVAVVSLAFAFFQTRADTLGLQRDLEDHAQVLAESLARSAEPLVARHANRELQRLVDRFKDREQIAGVSVYNANDEPLAISSGFARRVGDDPALLPKRGEQAGPAGKFVKLATGTIHMVTLPLTQDDAFIGTLSLFHDAAYIDLQAAAMWRRAFTGVFIQTILIVAVTLLTLRWGVGRPLRRMADWLQELRLGTIAKPPDMPDQHEFEPLTREVTRLASSLTEARAAAETEARLRDMGETSWTPERLRVFVQSRLAGSRLFAVSNREPYEHFHRSGGIECSVPASGLVTAIEPVLRACDGTWIAQATGDADRDTVDEYDRVRVPPDHPQYSLRRVWLTRGRRTRVLLRFRQRRIMAAVPHRAHTPGLPRRGLGTLSNRQPEVRRGAAGGNATRRKSRWCWCRIIISLFCRASSRMPAPMRGSPSSGTFPGPIPRPSGSAPGKRSCWTACWARI